MIVLEIRPVRPNHVKGFFPVGMPDGETRETIFFFVVRLIYVEETNSHNTPPKK
jgi:hypothetical protein